VERNDRSETRGDGGSNMGTYLQLLAAPSVGQNIIVVGLGTKQDDAKF